MLLFQLCHKLRNRLAAASNISNDMATLNISDNNVEPVTYIGVHFFLVLGGY
jgi:hypothetical protein